MSDSIPRIDRLVGDVAAAGTAGSVVSDGQYRKLVEAVSGGLGIPAPPGDPTALAGIAQRYLTADRDMSAVQAELGAVGRTTAQAWQGAAGDAAARSTAEVGQASGRTAQAYRSAVQVLDGLADGLRRAGQQHVTSLDQLGRSYQLLDSLSGFLPHRPTPAPGPAPVPPGGTPAPQGPTLAQLDAQAAAVYNTAHSWAVAGSGTMRAAAGLADETSRRAASELRDLAAKATAAGLAPTGLSAASRLAVSGAAAPGGVADENRILSATGVSRAAANAAALSAPDRQRLEVLLSGARSPQERAYLLKALAAGHTVAEIEAFDELIHAHGDDPSWLADRLTPIRGTGAPTPAGQRDTEPDYLGGGWDQVGPTCVASSTVMGRAMVDPLYSLQLTTGGHPGDPASDNRDAFLDRLHDEQQRDYDGARPFYADWPLVGYDGVVDDRGADLATREIGSRTGTTYTALDVDDPAGARGVLPQVEEAVDRGQPVPISIRGTVDGQPAGHQVLVIGHQGSMLQVYNPWGYTVWVSEDDFVNGHMDKAVDGMNLPTVTGVRLPESG